VNGVGVSMAIVCRSLPVSLPWGRIVARHLGENRKRSRAQRPER
jgi:hypothetical protein